MEEHNEDRRVKTSVGEMPCKYREALERQRKDMKKKKIKYDYVWCDICGSRLPYLVDDLENGLAGAQDAVKRELKGKNLMCWCPLGEPCHADILLQIANSE